MFIRFVNMLMSDVTYLLDESLTKLAEIRTLENELDDPNASASSNPVSNQMMEKRA